MRMSICSPFPRCVFVLTVWSIAAVAAPLAAAADRVDYNRDIKPILSDNCYKCHGPDDGQRQAGLRLDAREGAFARRESGFPVVPGESSRSLVYQRITAEDEFERMPPPETGKKLTHEQVELIKRWIDQGAEWRTHWSFVKPQRPVPPVQKPEARGQESGVKSQESGIRDQGSGNRSQGSGVRRQSTGTGQRTTDEFDRQSSIVNRQSKGPRNPIDTFILARLAMAGLAPNPQADRTTLIRRVTFDLTGLPPTIDEIDEFLADDRPDAYERLVDRLLASPRYGEHQSRFWLDAARYGDTHGLHLDNRREIWPYREWVIDAFNGNKPFDEFTIEQIAGDLLPEPSLDQLVATGFNRCNVTTSEGGAIPEEWRVRYAVDRVETMSTVFMGLTTGCAVCHEHKFDPISQKEFYKLFAYYYSVDENPMDGNQPLPPPVVKVPSPEQKQQLARYKSRIESIRETIETELAKIEYTDPGGDAAPALGERGEYVWIDDELPPGAKPAGNEGAKSWKWVRQPQPISGQAASTRTAEGLSQHFFTDAAPPLRIGKGDVLFAHVYLDPQNPPKQVMLQFNDGSWEHRAYWGGNHINWGADGTASRRRIGPLPEAGQWVRLEVKAADVGLNPGAALNGWAFTQFDGTVYWDKAGIVTQTPQGGAQFVSQSAWEAVQRELKKSSLPQPVQNAIKLPADKRNDARKKLVRDYFLEHVCTKTRSFFEPHHKEIAGLEKQIEELHKQIPGTLVMKDLDKPRPTWVLKRGEYDQPDKTQPVEPGVPAALNPLPEDAPPDRLGLARWLVDADHPLTARVTVNRFWQRYFGSGLVKTSEDFGSQGEWPSHPELLDWLAVEFSQGAGIRSQESGVSGQGSVERTTDNGRRTTDKSNRQSSTVNHQSEHHSPLTHPRAWDVKHIHRLIVTSAAYRQASKVTPEKLEKDPQNRLISRGPRFRLDAEMVRDQALAVSGLLVNKIGGPSVKPYQPPGIWEAVGYTDSNTAKFQRDGGKKLYRRSLYTFWKRTAHPPSMALFDAPSREECRVRRERTNTPLQALALMNDVQFVEASRYLAERMMTEGGESPGERITFAFRLATARRPDADELQVLTDAFHQHLTEYQRDKQAAVKLISVGESPRNENLAPAEHAAYTMVANLILNLDEAITKG